VKVNDLTNKVNWVCPKERCINLHVSVSHPEPQHAGLREYFRREEKAVPGGRTFGKNYYVKGKNAVPLKSFKEICCGMAELAGLESIKREEKYSPQHKEKEIGQTCRACDRGGPAQASTNE